MFFLCAGPVSLQRAMKHYTLHIVCFSRTGKRLIYEYEAVLFTCTDLCVCAGIAFVCRNAHVKIRDIYTEDC